MNNIIYISNNSFEFILYTKFQRVNYILDFI